MVSRGGAAAVCTGLVDVYSKTRNGLRGVQNVGPKGTVIIAQGAAPVQLTARHISGKNVNLEDEKLHVFLRELGRQGVGYVGKHEEVEYEFVSC